MLDPALKQATVLIVDDEPINIRILADELKSDYTIIAANSGESALKLVQSSDQLDLILLDVSMPQLDGFEVCKLLKSDEKTRSIPVVFVSANTDEATITRGLELGAYYYITKPAPSETLHAVVAAAISEKNNYEALQAKISQTENSISLLTEGTFHFRSFEEGRNLALLLAKACPESERYLMGFNELLANAVEHGNLGISYEEKGKLQQEGSWLEEIGRRLKLPENADKQVTVNFSKDDKQVCVHIKDEGKGFQWGPYLQLDTERITHSHGRGIAMARMLSFDDMKYLGKGNEVRIRINIP